MNKEEELSEQLSRLGYFIAKVEYWFAIGEIEYDFKRNWQGRIHRYMMNCVMEYTQQVSRGKAKEAYNMARGESPYIDFDDYWTQTQQQ